MTTKPSILVGAEDADFCLLLNHVLEASGFDTHWATDLGETLEVAAVASPDVVLLDRRPQSFPAAEACAHLKRDARTKHIPVVVLLDRKVDAELPALLKSGADDVHTRPIAPSTLLQCIRAFAGKPQTSAPAPKTAAALSYRDIELDPEAYRVRRDGRNVHLCPIEFRLLRYFMQNPDRAVTRDELFAAGWKENIHVGPRTVDVHVGLLRRALRSVSGDDPIRTVRSVGYALSTRPVDGEDSSDPRNA